MRLAETAGYAAVAAVWVFCPALPAQTTVPAVAPPRELSLVEGRGQLLRFQNDVTKVAVAEPKIADAIVVSPREIMVNAKSPGHTTLVIWETGAEPAAYDIAVSKDTA